MVHDNANGRILIVDDEPAVVRLLHQSMPKTAIVRSANTAEDALSLVDNLRPEIILLDLGMPGMGGIGLLDAIRQDERWAHVKIIVISGNPDPDARIQAYTAGADDFLPKPFSPMEVRFKVQRWIGLSRADELAKLKQECVWMLNDEGLSPFTPVMQAIQLLRQFDGVDDVIEVAHAIETMEFTADETLKRLFLLQEYLQWRNPDHRVTALQFELASLLQPMMGDWEAVVQQTGLAMEVQPFEEELTVTAHSKSIKRVIRWLFQNSVAYAESRVSVLHGREGRHVTYLEFVDDGPGFAPEALPHALHGFATGSRLNFDKDVGLHLSLSMEIVRAQGGALSIRDPGPGSTTVRLTLPS